MTGVGSGFDFDRLRRYPDVEAANLFAVDATDRLLLDEAAPVLQAAAPGSVVLVNDHYGALTLGVAALHGLTGLRVHQDLLSGELALANNAERLELTGRYRNQALDGELFSGATVVLIQAPKSIDALRETAELIARHAGPDVTVYLGGRVKHLSLSMNEVLRASFSDVRAGLARQKSRVITACQPRADAALPSFPRREWHTDLGLWICAYGGAFAGTRIDIGTRRLLGVLDELPGVASAIDLGCGTGVLATALARRGIAVLASDSSAAAVRSCIETVAANGVAELVTVQRDDALSTVASGSASLIVCNPPFHLGGAVHAGAAVKLFEAASRVLAPGGELWTVFNTHLGYQSALRRLIGPTRIMHSDAKFTVTASSCSRQ